MIHKCLYVMEIYNWKGQRQRQRQRQRQASAFISYVTDRVLYKLELSSICLPCVWTAERRATSSRLAQGRTKPTKPRNTWGSLLGRNIWRPTRLEGA
jgi:hypothetical protein